jgi:hypothetical protein
MMILILMMAMMIWFPSKTQCNNELVLRARRLLNELDSLLSLYRHNSSASSHAPLFNALSVLSECTSQNNHRPMHQLQQQSISDDWFCSVPTNRFRRADVVRSVRALVCDGTRRRDVIWREVSQQCSEARLDRFARVVFLHYAKTGGEFVEKTFDLMKNHRSASVRDEHGDFDRQKVLVVTVVRNPLERLVSLFRFCIHGHRTHLPKPRNICQRAVQLFDEHYPDSRAAFGVWLPFALSREAAAADPAEDVEIIQANFDSFITLANGRYAPDFVLRFKHLGDDLRALLCMLGVEFRDMPSAPVNSYNPDAMMPEANATRVRELYRADWLSLFDRDSLAIAERHFASDMVLN